MGKRIDAAEVRDVIYLDMRTNGMGGQGVIEVTQGDGGVLGDGLLETSGKTVGKIDTDIIAPYVGMASLVGVSGGNKERTGQSLAVFTESAAVAGLDGEEQFAVGSGLQDVAHRLIEHSLRAAEVHRSRRAISLSTEGCQTDTP